MSTTTQKCPYCGAGWAGKKISSRHVSACAKRNSAAQNPVSGSSVLSSTPAAPTVDASTAATASVDSMWQRFKARTRSAVGKSKEGMKPTSLSRGRKAVAIAGVALSSVGILSACSSEADVASQNLSTAAEQFEIQRRVVFFNGITDKYLLEIYGRCSVETSESALGGSIEVTCKTGPQEFKKHYLGLSDNVSYFVEQVEGADVSVYNYRVVFKPDVIVPDMEIDTQVIPTNK